MTEAIPLDDLQPGDILLSLGASKTSSAIRALDGGSYSHAALWTGQTVIESTTPVVVEHSLAESLALHPRVYVDAYRHVAVGARGPAVVGEARQYLDRPYAYGDLFLAALLMATTTWRPTSRWHLSVLLHGCQLNEFLRLDRPRPGELVTCTELAVRSYFQARLPIHVVPMGGDRFDRAAMVEAIAELAGGAIAKDVGGPLPAEEWSETQDLLRAKFDALTGADVHAEVRKGAVPSHWNGVSPLSAGGEWGANLVTPHYLEKSPDLAHVGRLEVVPAGAKALLQAGTPARRRHAT